MKGLCCAANMKKKRAFGMVWLSLLLLSACSPAPPSGEVATEPNAAVVPVASTSPTIAPAATIPPMPTAASTVAAVATPTVASQTTREATVTPTASPAAQIDPYVAARRILEQTEFAAPDGWKVTVCEGEAAFVCISDGQEILGYAELLLLPLTGYADGHVLRQTAAKMPAEAAAYTADHFKLARQALVALAEEHLEVIAADRVITYPDDAFVSLGEQPAQLGALPALAFGFVRTNSEGEVQERHLNIAAFDQQFLYWFGIGYDPKYAASFVTDTAVSQFEPFLYQNAANLPIHMPGMAHDESLPLPPPLISYSEQSGELPGDLTWALATELPRAAATVPVLSQRAQTEPLTAENAARVARTYGFNGPLYVEARPGISVTDAADLGLFAAFDGSRTLSLAGMPYRFTDVANWHQGPDLPFDEAAPIAERFLRAKGWLSLPYAMAESTQGEGVLFLPILDEVQLLSPAFGVRVAGNGEVSGMSIHVLDTLTPAGEYPIMTANTAWESLEKNPNQSGTFYRIEQPQGEPTAVASPIEYSNIPPSRRKGEFYTNIWAYRPLAGDFPLIVRSSDFIRIAGDVDLLAELVEQSDNLLHLWGTVDRPAPGLRELALDQWEVIEDAGGLPMFFGKIEHDGNQTLLVDEANQNNYVLPDAPSDLRAGDYAAVSGWPETASDVDRLLWQNITVYPPQHAAAPQPTAVPIQAVTVDSVKLVYLPQPASVTGLADNLFVPAWEFAGEADNGAQVTAWVAAISAELTAD